MLACSSRACAALGWACCCSAPRPARHPLCKCACLPPQASAFLGMRQRVCVSAGASVLRRPTWAVGGGGTSLALRVEGQGESSPPSCHLVTDRFLLQNNAQRLGASQSTHSLTTPVVSVATPSLLSQGLPFSSMPTAYNTGECSSPQPPCSCLALGGQTRGGAGDHPGECSSGFGGSPPDEGCQSQQTETRVHTEI